MQSQCEPLNFIGPSAGQGTTTSSRKNLYYRRTEKKPLNADRIRKISGSFAFIEHRFLRNGFWDVLDHHSLLLYLFLVIVADQKGISYYGYDKICKRLHISLEAYIVARDALIERDLIAFDGHLFQVLSLPPKVASPTPKTPMRIQPDDPVTIGQVLKQVPWLTPHE